jgi:hypothetical protein
VELPGRTQSRDAAADDDDRQALGTARRGERRAIANAMAERKSVVDEAAGDGSRGFGGEADQAGAERAEKCAA